MTRSVIVVYVRQPADLVGQLVKKAQNGDRRAVGEIYELFLDRIFRFIRFRISSTEDAEDVTQEVFMKMWRGLDNYRADGSPFEAWLYKIARNSVIDYYRGQKPAVALDNAFQIADGKKSPEVAALQSIGKQEALLGLKKLKHSYQEIIILKFIEDKDNREISAIIDKPVEHVRVLQSRALKALRAVI